MVICKEADVTGDNPLSCPKTDLPTSIFVEILREEPLSRRPAARAATPTGHALAVGGAGGGVRRGRAEVARGLLFRACAQPLLVLGQLGVVVHVDVPPHQQGGGGRGIPVLLLLGGGGAARAAAPAQERVREVVGVVVGSGVTQTRVREERERAVRDGRVSLRARGRGDGQEGAGWRFAARVVVAGGRGRGETLHLGRRTGEVQRLHLAVLHG